MKETVSVIIPLHNAGSYLQQTVRSVLEQRFTDWHLYIVDDLSTDQSAEIAKQLAHDHPDKITYRRMSEAAGKPAPGKNIGIKESSGEYIAFLDHDDWWEPQHLQALVSYLDDHADVGLVGSNGYFYDQESQKVLGTYRPVGERLTGASARRLTLTMPPYLTSSCMLLRRKALTELGPLNEQLGMSDDHELALRIVASGRYSLATLGEPTIYRRWLQTSFSNSTAAMSLIIKDVETIYQALSSSSNLTKDEKELLRQWRLTFRKRYANYLVSVGRYQEALPAYQEVLNQGGGGKVVRVMAWLARFLPPLARFITTTKRQWSFNHPPLYPLS